MCKSHAPRFLEIEGRPSHSPSLNRTSNPAPEEEVPFKTSLDLRKAVSDIAIQPKKGTKTRALDQTESSKEPKGGESLAKAPQQKQGEQEKPPEEEEEKTNGENQSTDNPARPEEEKVVSTSSQASSPAKGRRTTLEVTPQQDSLKVSGMLSMERRSVDSRDLDPTSVRYSVERGLWFPLLSGLAALVLDRREELQKKGIETLYNILQTYNDRFSDKLWGDLFSVVLKSQLEDLSCAVSNLALKESQEAGRSSNLSTQQAENEGYNSYLKSAYETCLRQIIILIEGVRSKMDLMLPLFLGILQEGIVFAQEVTLVV